LAQHALLGEESLLNANCLTSLVFEYLV